METNQSIEEQLKSAFCEVRKAHRLIYEYQQRMKDLCWFIRVKLGFNENWGYKRFSEVTNNDKKIEQNKLSWDWIYTYVYEYFIGYQKVGEEKILGLSIIQVSDTGCYKDGKRNFNLSNFPSAEESDSRLMFYLTIKPNDAQDMDWRADEIIEQNILKDSPQMFVPKNRSELVKITYSVPLYKFSDEESTVQILQSFVKFCNDNAGTKLQIQE